MQRIAVVLFLFFISLSAQAEWGDQYLLAKAGLIKINVDSADALASVGLMYGFGLTNNISAEAELNLGLAGGSYETATDSGEYRIWTLAGYGTWRHSFTPQYYTKAKIGIAYENIENNATVNPTDKTATGFGVAGGAGFGMVAGKVLTAELEWTMIDRYVHVYTLGLHYRF